MKKYFKVLLATDYSEQVMNAERYALLFAKNTNSVITMLHVYQQSYISPEVEANYSEITEKNRDLEFRKLEEHRDKLFASLKIQPSELNCECIIREGRNAGKEILREADNSEADFIIVGTHGASRLSEVYFGTHAWKVIKNAGIPVLAIPQDAMFTRIKNMVFATEYREGEIPVIQFLVHLAKQYNAELTILHVSKDNNSEDAEKQLSEKFMSEIKSEIDYPKINIKIIRHNNLIEALNNYCAQNTIDFLIMSPEKKVLFQEIFNPNGSVVKKMSLQTRVPLFTIPDFYNPVYAKFWDIIEVNDYMKEEF